MTKWTTGTCQTNGINIHYLRTGGNKPPVVLLHGLMMNGTCWTPVARALEKNYDVVMPDARGHGNSSAPSQGYSYDTLAADVLNLIEVLRLTKPVLLGHSMGGMTAALAASQNPKQLRGLVLVDPTFFESSESDEKRQLLNVVFQNLQLDNTSLSVSVREPFLTMMDFKNRPGEWGRLVSNQLQPEGEGFTAFTPLLNP